MSGFQDPTSAWFNSGEDPEVIAHTKEVELLPRRWPRVLGVCVALTIAASGVTWALLGHESRVKAATALVVTESSTPPASSAPSTLKVPAQPLPPAAAEPKPTEPKLDRSREWKRENIIGERLLQKGRNGFALERFQRVLDHQPSEARALRGKCIALDRLGRRNEAADACRRALKVNPNDIQARRTLARIYYLGGAFSWSAAEWRKVLAQSPNDREAKTGLRAAESKRHKTA